MWYIHTFILVKYIFSVHWHDIPPHMIKSYDTNNSWMEAYIHLVQYSDLASDPCLHLRVCLLGMHRNAQKYAGTCVTNDDDADMLEANTESGIFVAPCGKLHVQGVIETFPVTYTWAIRVGKHFRVNTSVAAIDVP